MCRRAPERIVLALSSPRPGGLNSNTPGRLRTPERGQELTPPTCLIDRSSKSPPEVGTLIQRQWCVPDLDAATAPFLAIEFRKADVTLRFFTILTSFGTPRFATWAVLSVRYDAIGKAGGDRDLAIRNVCRLLRRERCPTPYPPRFGPAPWPYSTPPFGQV